MIVWQGFGFLGPLVPMAGYVVLALLVGAIGGKPYLATHSWPGALGTLLGAALLFFISERLDRPGRLLVDPLNGETVVLKKKHTFFFLPLRYLALLFAAISVGMLLLKSDSSL